MNVARREHNEGLAFFGKVVAGQSHEVTNVLNIINELAGLQIDVLQDSPSGVVDTEKLAGIAGKIEEQVRRGVKIVSEINRFAHSVDVSEAVFDLRELLEHVAFLAERIVRMRRARLDFDSHGPPVPFEGNPFLIQQIVFNCVDLVVAPASAERTVLVSCREETTAAMITVSSDDETQDIADHRLRLERLSALVELAGGEIVGSPEPGRPRLFILRLPTRRETGPVGGDQHREGCDAS